jgi:glycosyltransferase involved in cell wall biosynthesis
METETSEAMAGLVSVVIPTRNRPRLLLAAIASVLRQTYSLLEVVLVIDGDDPATLGELGAIVNRRVRVVRLAENVGGAEARNVGVRAALGEWIAFLDDDDEWLSSKLDRQMRAALASPEPFPVVATRLCVRTPAGDSIGPVRDFRPSAPVSEYLFCREHLRDGPHALQTSSLLVRREMMLAHPFRKGLKRHQDWDWVLRASRVPGVAFAVLPEALTIYRTHDARSSVGRALDWCFSFEWGREMRGYFTSRAYGFFLATECLPRAVKSGAGARAYVTILREFLAQARPTARSVMFLAAFLVLRPALRERLRDTVRWLGLLRRKQARPAQLAVTRPSA